MKKLISVFTLNIILLTFGFKLMAQQAEYVNRKVSDFINDVEFHNNVNKLPPDLEGSPYMNDAFTDGSIYLEGKYKFNDIPLRYNIYNDVMEFKSSGHIMDLDERHKIDSVVINGNTFVYLVDQGNRQAGYYKLLARGKVELLQKLRVEFRQRESAKPLRDPVPPKFVKLPEEYFIKLPGGEVEEVKNAKKLVEALNDHQNALNGFVKKEKIKNHDPDDLAKLINYYNTL